MDSFNFLDKGMMNTGKYVSCWNYFSSHLVLTAIISLPLYRHIDGTKLVCLPDRFYEH